MRTSSSEILTTDEDSDSLTQDTFPTRRYCRAWVLLTFGISVTMILAVIAVIGMVLLGPLKPVNVTRMPRITKQFYEDVIRRNPSPNSGTKLLESLEDKAALDDHFKEIYDKYPDLKKYEIRTHVEKTGLADDGNHLPWATE